MQPEDFITPTSAWQTHCQLCGRPHGLAEWAIPRVCCIKIGIDREANGVVITPNTITGIMIEHTRDNRCEKLTLVDFYEDSPTYSTIAHMYNKSAVGDEIYAGARAYWRRYCHREYQHAIAQALQRELDLPGEITAVISELA